MWRAVNESETLKRFCDLLSFDSPHSSKELKYSNEKRTVMHGNVAYWPNAVSGEKIARGETTWAIKLDSIISTDNTYGCFVG